MRAIASVLYSSWSILFWGFLWKIIKWGFVAIMIPITIFFVAVVGARFYQDFSTEERGTTYFPAEESVLEPHSDKRVIRKST